MGNQHDSDKWGVHSLSNTKIRNLFLFIKYENCWHPGLQATALAYQTGECIVQH